MMTLQNYKNSDTSTNNVTWAKQWMQEIQTQDKVEGKNKKGKTKTNYDVANERNIMNFILQRLDKEL